VDQLIGKKRVVRGKELLRPPPPHSITGFLIFIKDDVNGFSSTSDISYMGR
jgi:hypothetical protein